MLSPEKRLTGSVGAILVLLLVSFLIGGCGNGKKSSSDRPPSGKGNCLYTVKAAEKTLLTLERAKKVTEIPLPPEYDLFDADILENKGEAPASIKDVAEGHKFVLSPEARIQVGARKLVLFRGKSLFEFRKISGEFKIVLPHSTLGIRGTRFLVQVQPDGVSVVQMFEGRLEIEKDGRITPLEGQETAIISPTPETDAPTLDSSTGIQIIPPGGTFPDFLKEFENNDGSALQKF